MYWKEQAAVAEMAATKKLADQELKSRQELDLKMAHRSTEDAMRLEESESDSAGGFLWLLQAWDHLQKSAKALEPKEREYLLADYRLRLGMALRRLPRIAHLLYHKDYVASAISEDGRFAATIGHDGTVRRWSIADQKYDEWRLDGPEQAINGVSLSADGGYVVVCTGDPGTSGRAFIYDATGKRVAVLAHNGRVMMAAFPPNPRDPLMATVGDSANGNGEIKLWQIGTWDLKLAKAPEPAKVLVAPGLVKHLTFGVEGSRLAFVGKDQKKEEGFCMEWDSNQPAKPPMIYPIRAATRPARAANYVAYSADGKQMAVACGEQDDDQSYACVFDVANADYQLEPTQKTPSDGVPGMLFHGGAVNHVRFSHDGRRVVTSSEDGTAKVWAFRGVHPAGPPRNSRHVSSVFAAEFSPDGQSVATASRDLRARVWDAETGEPASAILQHNRTVSGVRFTPDGRQIITQSSDMLRVWDPWSGVIPPFLFAVSSIIDHVDCDPKSLRVAASGHRHAANPSGTGWARVWDAKTGEQLTPELSHPSRVTHATLSPDGGRFLVTVCDDSFVRVWDVASGRKTAEKRPLATGQLRFAAFSPDGRRLVTAGGDRVASRGVAQVWTVSPEGKIDPASRELGHRAPITFAAFSPDGNRVVTVTGDLDANLGEAKVWEWSAAAPAVDLKDQAGHAHQEAITHAAFSGDGSLLVTASNDDTARIWNVKSGALRRELKNHTADVVFASFSHGGDFVVTTGKDRMAIVWDANTGTPDAILAHKAGVNHAVFSPDSRYLATACRDGTFRIWSIKSGLLVDLRRQPGDARFVAYTGADHGSTIGILSMNSPGQSGEAEGGTLSSSPIPGATGYQVGLGVWDFSPGREPPVEPMRRIGEAIAARRIAGEVEMVPITPDELKDDWSRAGASDGVLPAAPSLYEWHNRAVVDNEAKGRWSAAIWHLERLVSTQKDLLNTYARKAHPMWSSAARILSSKSRASCWLWKTSIASCRPTPTAGVLTLSAVRSSSSERIGMTPSRTSPRPSS